MTRWRGRPIRPARHGILDVFSPDAQQPVRCDFFDDEIDALGLFDPGTQRRTENIESALLLPAGRCCPPSVPRMDPKSWRPPQLDMRKGRALPLSARLCAVMRRPCGRDDPRRQRPVYGGGVPGFRLCRRLFARKCLGVYQREQPGLRGAEALAVAAATGHRYCRGKRLVGRGIRPPAAGAGRAGARTISQYPVCQMEPAHPAGTSLAPEAMAQVAAKQLSVYGGSLDTAVTDLTHYLTTGYRVLVLCGGRVRADNLQRLLREREDPCHGGLPGQRPAPARAGGHFRGCPVRRQRVSAAAGHHRRAADGQGLRQGAPGAEPPRKVIPRVASPPILHRPDPRGPGGAPAPRHRPVRGHDPPAGGRSGKGLHQDRLRRQRLPVRPGHGAGSGEQVYRQRRDTSRTKLNKLGGTEWAKTTYRAKAAAKDLAKGLIDLYARRQRLAASLFRPDSPWQQGLRAFLTRRRRPAALHPRD